MKKLYFSSLFICISIISFGQIVNIPDANFKSRLVNTNCAKLTSPAWLTDVDTNNDGQIQLTEAQNVLELDVSTNEFNSSNDIFSMEGIASFSNLTKLACNGNNFTTLDVSMLPSLVDLNCDHSYLNSLNVAGLTNLEILWCSFNSLTAINLSGLTNLKTFYCVVNSITTLDVSDSLLLINFQCEQNQISSLILGNKPELKSLLCNNNPITTINPQLFPNIEWLICNNTLISSIDLQGLNSLYSLELNATLLSEIDCSQTPNLNKLYCSYNPNLTSINVRNGILSFGDPDLLDFPFRFDNLPNIASICMDDGEQNNLINTLYNSNENVQVFGGPNCDVLLNANTNIIENPIVLYPNPVTDLITIKKNNTTEIEFIAIYNPLGQLVKTLAESEVTTSSSIDVSTLKTGTYFMEITSTNGKTTKKFVKL